MSVVITDRDGKIEYVNPEFTKVTGYTLAEAIGQNPRILKSEHAARTICGIMEHDYFGRRVRGAFLNKKKNGELFWGLLRSRRSSRRKITSFVAVKEDITERKEVEEQLHQSQKMGRGPTHRRHRPRFQQSARHRHGQSAAVARERVMAMPRLGNTLAMLSGRQARR